MSIIQKIRDRAAWIISGAIGLALIAFIVQDAFQNQSLFSGSSTTLGKVNGKAIDAIEFEGKYKTVEEQYQTAGYPLNEMMRQNIREQIWNDYVEDAIMGRQYSKLGIDVSDKELSDILYGANPPQDLRQQFTDPNTGQYDATAAYQQIQALRKQKNSPAHKSFFEQYLPALAKSRQKEKYTSLLGNSVYVPKWMVEKINAESSQKSAITYVNIPYSTIADSLVKVTDEEITEYVSKHKAQYKQEKVRGIEYVMFDASPTKADSASIYNQVIALKNEFLTTDDVQSFLVRNGSETQFFDGYVLKSKMQMTNPDSIQALPVGSVYGPYIDGSNYVLAKMLDKKTLPDSIFSRHILIRTSGENPTPDSTAKKRIDSVVAAIKAGADFNQVMIQVSDDKEAIKLDGGIMKFSSEEVQNKERFDEDFARFIFLEGKKGERKIVKSKFGYHYIEIVDQKNFEPAYKVAYYSKAIIPSDETVNTAMGLASQFAADARNRQQFDEIAKKKNLNKFKASDIRPLQSAIVGVGDSRELVRWMYEAKVGEVSDRPFAIENKYVVPVLIQAYEEGTMPVEIARPLVEHLIRNQKKAAEIRKKIGNANTLDAVSQSTGQPVMRADSIFFNSPFIPNVGQEVKVVGAAFNTQFQAKISAPIEGNGGVFVIKVENISAVPNPNMDVIQQQSVMQQELQRSFSDFRSVIEIKKKAVKIKDNRHKFF